MSDARATSESVLDTFIGMLTYDVLVALRRTQSNDSQTARRDLIRTLFAAIEGYVWELREHIGSIAKDVDELESLMAMALAEASYSVSENGKLIEQQRYVALPSMVRLVCNLAVALCPGLKVDFSGEGWADFKRTIVIRNRVTHPKRKADLNLSADDEKTAWSGLIWLLETTTHVMRGANSIHIDYHTELTQLLDQLVAGDPGAMENYRSSLADLYGSNLLDTHPKPRADL